MANTKRLCCEAFVNRASRIPAPIHRFKEGKFSIEVQKFEGFQAL